MNTFKIGDAVSKDGEELGEVDGVMEFGDGQHVSIEGRWYVASELELVEKEEG